MDTRTFKSEPKAGFDKYYFYQESVQSPHSDADFLRKTYKDLKKKEPVTLGEDFCGTYAICCEWVKLNKNFKAIGVDLDSEPISYGTKNYLSQLKKEEQKRIAIKKANVLDPKLPKVDIIAAMNFSYFIFKARKELVDYFKNCLKRLKKDGVLIADCFGGSQCQEANEEETEHDNFSYFWDQEWYDPVNNHGLFYIHFKPEGKKKQEKVFTYDWRMWSIPEIREAMLEAGFKKAHVYWEGSDDDGEGDGEFTRVDQTDPEEDCESWIAYVVGEK